MESVFIKAMFDLHCDWEGLAPIYRIYVNDELFAERTFIWTDNYLAEMLQIQAPPGRYSVRLETVGPNLAKFHVENHRIEHGQARWVDGDTIEIAG